MTDNEGRLARRIAFLESELFRMRDDANDAEQVLRRNPTDPDARDRVAAIYEAASAMWQVIQELQSRRTERRAAGIGPIFPKRLRLQAPLLL